MFRRNRIQKTSLALVVVTSLLTSKKELLQTWPVDQSQTETSNKDRQKGKKKGEREGSRKGPRDYGIVRNQF